MRLIDADKLKQDVLSWENCYNGFSDTYDKARIIDEIDDAPTIDAETARHGKWTRNYESSWGDSRFMCSVCHCKESVPTCNGEPTVWDYCPNCGAKMEEENEGQTILY